MPEVLQEKSPIARKEHGAIIAVELSTLENDTRIRRLSMMELYIPGNLTSTAIHLHLT